MSTWTISGDGAPPSGCVIHSSMVFSPTLEVHHPRISLKRRPQPINILGEERVQRRLDPLVAIAGHRGAPPRRDCFC